MKERIVFIAKITVIHVITYILCGILFMTIFHYGSNMTEIGMRPVDSLIVGLAPVFQIIRGILFGIALWLFRVAYISKKIGWLVLWVILVILGILNTPGTGAGSIERIIYYEGGAEFWNLMGGGMLEVLTQMLLFSIFTTWILNRRKKVR